MTLFQRVTAARRDFAARYGQYPNAILLGPSAELEMQAHVSHLSELGLTRPANDMASSLLCMKVIPTPDIQDFIVCLIHDHTV